MASSASTATVARVAHEFLKESRKLRGTPSSTPHENAALTDQRIVGLEETVRTLESRIAALELGHNGDGTNNEQNLLLKKAETVIQALLIENQRLRGAAVLNCETFAFRCP